MDSNTWLGHVVEDGDGLAIVFPPEMIDSLGWKEGDTLTWNVGENNKIVLVHTKSTDGQ
jgi:antitoxin component of MazEF toxin-antitoxin module